MAIDEAELQAQTDELFEAVKYSIDVLDVVKYWPPKDVRGEWLTWLSLVREVILQTVMRMEGATEDDIYAAERPWLTR